jgi:hypothetical protein
MPMHRAASLVVLLAASAAQAQVTQILPGVELPAGAEIESRVNGDLNGDGIEDAAYVAHNDDSRALTVVLPAKDEFSVDYRTEVLVLEPTAFAPGTLTLDGTVLAFEDTTGGTTAVSSTRRFRYDGRGGQMRLIGLDARAHSRTYAHDGFETSWNLLNGDATTRELKRNTGGGDAAYNPGPQHSFKRRIRAQWLADSPDPEVVLEEMRDG